MKKFIYLFGVSVLFFSFFSVGLGQETTDYVPLAPIPGFTPGTGDQALGQYINSLYRLSIGLGAVLAVLMIVVGGLQYMSTDAFSGKSAGKTRIQQALMGLGLLLASFIILNTINPELLDLDVELTTATSTATLSNFDPYLTTQFCARTTIPGEEYINEDGLTRTYLPMTSNECFATYEECSLQTGQNCSVKTQNIEYLDCVDCINTENTNLRFKDNGLACYEQNQNGCEINKDLAESLLNIQNQTPANEAFWVTEGHPPTVKHQAKCHQVGSCVDVNFTDRSTDFEDIKNFLDRSNQVGLYSVYEANGSPRGPELRQYLINEGRSDLANQVIDLGVGVSHFSVYRNKQEAQELWFTKPTNTRDTSKGGSL